MEGVQTGMLEQRYSKPAPDGVRVVCAGFVSCSLETRLAASSPRNPDCCKTSPRQRRKGTPRKAMSSLLKLYQAAAALVNALLDKGSETGGGGRLQEKVRKVIARGRSGTRLPKDE